MTSRCSITSDAVTRRSVRSVRRSSNGDRRTQRNQSVHETGSMPISRTVPLTRSVWRRFGTTGFAHRSATLFSGNAGHSRLGAGRMARGVEMSRHAESDGVRGCARRRREAGCRSGRRLSQSGREDQRTAADSEIEIGCHADGERKAGTKKSNEAGNGENGGIVSLTKELFQAALTLRGSVEPADYKRYVLPIIFLRFLSLRYDRRCAELEALVADKSSDYYGDKGGRLA
jgi:hypothetical protein